MNTIPWGPTNMITKVAEAEALPKTDPLVSAIAKTRRSGAHGEFERLLKRQSHWQKKATVANNKLLEVREDIKNFSRQLAYESDVDGVKIGSVLQRYYDRKRKEGEIK